MRPLRPADEKGLKKVYLAYLLLLNAHAVMNFALLAIIPSSQQSAVFSDSPAIILVLSTADPKTHCSGSSFFPTARSIAKTQHVPLIHMPFLLYIVFLPPFRDPACCSRKQCFAYSLTVVNFRKYVNTPEIGSTGKADTVI